MNTTVIFGGCFAVFITLTWLLWRDWPENPDRRREENASKSRHPSNRVTSHVRRVDAPNRPYDQDIDE